jgi:hypothetical protein
MSHFPETLQIYIAWKPQKPTTTSKLFINYYKCNIPSTTVGIDVLVASLYKYAAQG